MNEKKTYQAVIDMRVEASLPMVRVLCATASAFAQQYASSAVSAAIELCIAEAASNIVEHAYADQHGIIEVRLLAGTTTMEVHLRDYASIFNPVTEQEIEDVLDDFGHVTESSLGVGRIVIREMMDVVKHKALDDGNLLIMKKNYSEKDVLS